MTATTPADGCTGAENVNTYWGTKDTERLVHDCADDAIEAIIGDLDDPIAEIGDVTVHEYKSESLNFSANQLLSEILERLDEDYGDPDGDLTQPTPAMLAAAQTFASALRTDYFVWRCVTTGRTVTVNALEWVKQHRPDWLEPS